MPKIARSGCEALSSSLNEGASLDQRIRDINLKPGKSRAALAITTRMPPPWTSAARPISRPFRWISLINRYVNFSFFVVLLSSLSSVSPFLQSAQLVASGLLFAHPRQAAGQAYPQR